MSVANPYREASVDFPVTANAVLVPTFAGTSIVINIVPLLILSRVRNLAAVALVGTNMLINVWAFINGCIWPTDDWASWWNGVGLCDIEATLRTPLYSLLALATCVLMRDLARAVDVDNPRLFETSTRRRKRIAFDILCIFGLPIVQLPLHYVVQYNRYSIAPIYGCVDLLDYSWPRIVLLSMWPMLIGILSCYYSILTMFRLRKHRGTLSSTLSHNGSGLNSKKFIKLFSMTTLLLIIYLPVICYFFYINIPQPFIPYSWSRIHNPEVWSYIIFFHTSDLPDVQYWPWVPIGLAFIIFIWYGLTTEAIECYRRPLVFCGLAKIWPVLKEPYQPSRSGSVRSTQSSWSARIDVFEKAASYLDRSHKQTSQNLGTASTGRLNSVGTVEEASRKHSKTSTFSDPDVISPVSSASFAGEKQFPSVAEVESAKPGVTVPINRGFFSAFRTHINLPFPLFTPSFANTAPTDAQAGTTSTTYDLEKQDNLDSPHVFTTNNTVETNIWSGSVHEEEELDPASPKIGTRAYREREREKERRESRKKNMMSGGRGVLADEVRVGELPIQGGQEGGVEVRRELRQEESTEGSSTRP